MSKLLSEVSGLNYYANKFGQEIERSSMLPKFFYISDTLLRFETRAMAFDPCKNRRMGEMSGSV